MPKAVGLAAELKEKFGAEVELIRGSYGDFEVRADDRLVYSKTRTGRFPEAGEVSRSLGK
ncbi:MAG: SelT/SelW/SelH family protein [Myxococcales bacterium]|nr:SelT/SelW/SelH family protein [Myxococcales bacterium]